MNAIQSTIECAERQARILIALAAEYDRCAWRAARELDKGNTGTALACLRDADAARDKLAEALK